MSQAQTGNAAVRDRIRDIVPGDEDTRHRLLDAADEIPLTDMGDIISPGGVPVGARGIDRDVADAYEREGNRSAPLSSWVRDHLTAVEDDYVYRMWKRWAFFVTWRIPQYGYGGYDEMRTMVYKLRRLGLIETTREEPTLVQGRPQRQFYTAVEEEYGADEWQNPTASLYPDSTPKNVVAAVDEAVREEGGRPDLVDVAAGLDLTTEQLEDRLDQWGFSVQQRVETVLGGEGEEEA